MFFSITAPSSFTHSYSQVPIPLYGIAQKHDAKNAPCRGAQDGDEQEDADVYDGSDQREEPHVLDAEGCFDEVYGEVVEEGLGEDEDEGRGEVGRLGGGG